MSKPKQQSDVGFAVKRIAPGFAYPEIGCCKIRAMSGRKEFTWCFKAASGYFLVFYGLWGQAVEIMMATGQRNNQVYFQPCALRRTMCPLPNLYRLVPSPFRVALTLFSSSRNQCDRASSAHPMIGFIKMWPCPSHQRKWQRAYCTFWHIIGCYDVL